MNGITDDVRFLEGRVIEQTRSFPNLLQLKLHGKYELSVESDVSWRGVRSGVAAVADAAALTGKRITRASVRDGKDLVLELEGRDELVIHDSNENYESFTITGPGLTIVV
jgi:hypothetical protein